MTIVELDIRNAETAEEVWALQHPAYRLEAALIGVADLPPLRDTVVTLQSCGESFLGFREEDGELVGALSYEREGPNGYAICRMMVHPDRLRRGIASKLIGRMLAGELSGAEWSVTAEVRNAPAIALYERFGFGRRETFSPIPGIEMARMVRPSPAGAPPT